MFQSRPEENSMSMTPRAGLQVAEELAAFIEDEALPGLGIDSGAFWAGAAAERGPTRSGEKRR